MLEVSPMSANPSDPPPLTIPPSPSTPESSRPAERTKVILTPAESDRRADVEGKQARVAELLQEAGADGLLVLEPENFAWLTSGGTAKGALDRAELPALFYTPEQRGVLCSNVDSQRIFDEEVNGLGFDVREWPWHLSRKKFLQEFCADKRYACDQFYGGLKPVGDQFRLYRRTLSGFEQACVRVLGQMVSHALEATGRSMKPGELTEQEVAGQICHRVLHKGAEPIAVSVAADGRSQLYRQASFTSEVIHRSCVMTLTARKFGLCVTAGRTLSFGPPDASLEQEQEAACKISATYIASTWPDGLPSQILAAGKRVYQVAGYEHEWRLGPQGFVTGRSPVELALSPQTEELFHLGYAVTWRVSVGSALSCDTFLITERGPESITPAETWPQKKIRVQGGEFLRPFILQR
jgi:Xaa-Pro aminopeptidase